MLTDNRALQLSGQLNSAEFIDRCLHHLSDQNCREFINDSARDLNHLWLALYGQKLTQVECIIASTLMFCWGNFGRTFDHELEIAQAMNLAIKLKEGSGIRLNPSDHPFSYAARVFAKNAIHGCDDDLLLPPATIP